MMPLVLGALPRGILPRGYWASGLEVVHGVAEEMPFGDGCFDLIVSNNGINNVDDPSSFIRMLQGVGTGLQIGHHR